MNRPSAEFFEHRGHVMRNNPRRLEKGDAVYKLDGRGLPVRRLMIDRVDIDTAFSGEKAILRHAHGDGFFLFYSEKLYKETDERRRIFAARRIASAANKAANEGDDKLLEKALFLLTGEG